MCSECKHSTPIDRIGDIFPLVDRVRYVSLREYAKDFFLLEGSLAT